MPGPVATIGSLHVCPMCSGTVPHVGGPVSGPGAPNILINGKPAALMGDMCVCIGPPDVIAQGAPSVFFNGVPVACQGDMTAHGGMISAGEPNVILGTAVPTPSVTMPKHKIPFPKISITNRILGNAKEAIVRQKELAELAPVYEVEENSKEVALETTLPQDQLYLLATNCTLDRFLMYMISVFGKDIPSKAYEELYHDAKDKAGVLEPVLLVKPSIPYGGKALFYNDKEVQEIWVGEKIIREAAEDNETSGELMVVLIEEYGHWIDYLLRNYYAETKRKDALRDEGAYFSYKMLRINHIDEKDQYYADATIEGASYQLTWDYEPFQKGLQEFVSEDRWYKDDHFGAFEFYKAGFLNKEGEFAHGDIEFKGLSISLVESGLQDFLSLKEENFLNYIRKIYFGNWKRDYSQGLDPMIIRLFSNALAAFAEDNTEEDVAYEDVIKRFDISRLMTDTIPEKKTITYSLKLFDMELWSANFSPVDKSVKVICTILEMLAAKEFVFQPLEEKNIKANINYKQYLETLAKDFSPVNRENLGVYVPAEHIDNPKAVGLPIEYTDENGEKSKKENDDHILLPEFIGKDVHTQEPNLHDLNMEYGMKNYIRHAASSEKVPVPAKNRYVNSHVYILHKLRSASKNGGYSDKNCKQDLGAALHTLEDFFAHSNYAEIALIKEGAYGVFPWVTKVPGKIDYLRYVRDPRERARVNNNPKKYNVVQDAVGIHVSNELTTKIPLVTGTFGMMDTMASLLPIVAHSFDYQSRVSKRETKKENERAEKEKNGSFYYKDNINSRTFVEVLFLELLRDVTNEEEGKDSVAVGTLLEALAARDTVYEAMQEASNNAHEWFEGLPEMVKDNVRKLRDSYRGASQKFDDFIDEKIDAIMEPFYGIMYNFLQMVASNINDIQVAQTSEIERLRQEAENDTWDLKIGVDPTHTQVAKDDPHHPMHTLSAELAIEAVSRVGTAVFNTWQEKGDFDKVKHEIDALLKHPAQTTWQSATVKKWMKKNRSKICQASTPSVTIDRLLHVNEEIKEVLRTLEETSKKPAFKKINDYREKLYKDAKAENEEEFETFEDTLHKIKTLIKEQDDELTEIQKLWDTQFPKSLYCRMDQPPVLYKVKRGDTLSEIAKKGNTSVEDLLELNPYIDPDTKVIYAGGEIKVPYPVIEFNPSIKH